MYEKDCNHDEKVLNGGMFHGDSKTMMGESMETWMCTKCGKYVSITRKGKFVIENTNSGGEEGK